ncbi:MAG: translation initiation inhibitor [Planctomycetaceae bacterium]|nr:translation initiation inhibitor [Planctomycetaceae bacterium]
MNRPFRDALMPIGLLILFTVQASAAEPTLRHISVDDGKSTDAVRVTNADLAHTTQLLAAAGGTAEVQSQVLLKQLDRVIGSHKSQRSDLVKLNVYVRDASVSAAFLLKLKEWTDDKLPAVCWVQSRLPHPSSLVGLDAVFVARDESDRVSELDPEPAESVVLSRGDVVYVSGQAEAGDLAEATRLTLKGLERTLKHVGLEKSSVAQVKCFLQPMKQVSVVNTEISRFFTDSPIPPVSHVEWISGSRPIEIEVIAWAPETKSDSSVSYITPPWMKSSAVFSRVARIHGNDRLYVSGVYSAKPGDGKQQVSDIFTKLQSILKAGDSDLSHLAKATYYVSEDDASNQLNRLRPMYYDPKRPPAASKAKVFGVGMQDRGITLDMIAAPIK